MSATVLPFEKQLGVARLVLREAPPEQRRPIVTRSETAECTCPDACERDHERD